MSLLRNFGKVCKISGAVSSTKKIGPCLMQVANITAPHHQKPDAAKDKPKPWPYEKRGFNTAYSIIDAKTEDRLDENSRIITVEGNMGVGKTKFAKQLADHLGFKYISGVDLNEYYFNETHGVDPRDLGFMMPSQYQIYDLAKFCNDTEPEKHGKAGRLQLTFLNSRYFKYLECLAHLLNTGQGVVVDSSVWSDMVFARSLRDCNYITKQGFKYYNFTSKNVMCELFKPHLVVYLDASTQYIQNQIKKMPLESKAKALNTKFLDRLEHNFKNNFLPQMRKNSEVLVYDVENPEDWEIVIEDVEQLNLEEDHENEEKFKDWLGHNDDAWCFYRTKFTSKRHMDTYWSLPMPYDAPELFVGEDETGHLRNVMNSPVYRYRPGYNMEMGDSVLNILLDRPNVKPKESKA